MITTNELELKDDYYHMKFSCRQVFTGSWQARASVMRNDSNELVGGIAEMGQNEEQAQRRLQERSSACFASFIRPPHEWGRLELRRLLIAYRKFNNDLTLILARLKKQLAAGQLSEDCLAASYHAARERLVEGSVMLARKLEMLPESDRIDLMTSPNEIYQEPANPWHLDDMDARDALFNFILDPSEAIINAHNIHRARWGGR